MEKMVASHPVSLDGMMRGADLQPVRLFSFSRFFSTRSRFVLRVPALRESVLPVVIAMRDCALLY